MASDPTFIDVPVQVQYKSGNNFTILPSNKVDPNHFDKFQGNRLRTTSEKQIFMQMGGELFCSSLPTTCISLFILYSVFLKLNKN